jgi:hypothetical protein
MFRKIFAYLMLPLLLAISSIPGSSFAQSLQKTPDGETGVLQKLLVVGGSAAMDLDLNRLNGKGATPGGSKLSTLRFDVAVNSFFTFLVFNDDLRGALPGSMGLVSQNTAALPSPLSASYQQLMIEKTAWGEHYELVVRDGKTGFTFFNIEGNQYEYDAVGHVLGIKNGRLLISEEFAKKLGRPADAGSIAGSLSVTVMTSPIEVTTVANGEVESAVMPSMQSAQPSAGTVPGPDVIVGDLNGLSQPDTASAGTQVGISVGTDSCNLGAVNLDWFRTPDNNHPVIPQNFYRMSANADRFEQIGQSSVKHAFTALTENICGLGCNGVGDTHLGSGCSDPYVVSLNSGGSGHTLGSRAWINPFTGAFPRGDSVTPPNSHSGHTHNAVSHRMLVEIGDLNTTLNPGASYYAEAQYITPHEFVWCGGHHGECNMFNNVSYRRYNVTGTTGPFSFPTGGFTTVRMQPAVNAWTGATINTFEPDPGNDGIAAIAYKVTNPSAGVWHYEYAVYNQNLDRAIQSFSVPLGCGITASNLGFHAPPQQPAWAADGTAGNAGFSSTPWTSNPTANAVSWNSQTFAQNQNANAIRWGTLYNFRFDSNQPPQAANATVGFFKTGSPVTVAIQAPSSPCTPLQLTGAASSKMHSGQGPYTVDLPLTGPSGTECRSGGDTGDHTIVFTFSNNVTSGNATMTNGAGSTSGNPAFAGNTMTVNLTGVTNAQEIAVKLSGVTDSFAQVMSDTTINMKVLLGDVDGSGAVTGVDVNFAKVQVGATVSTGNFKEDVNLTDSITGVDVNVVKGQVGTSLSRLTPTK